MIQNRDITHMFGHLTKTNQSLVTEIVDTHLKYCQQQK